MRLLLAFFFSIVCTFQSFAGEIFSISYENGRVVKRYPENSRPVIGLALSGGGSRGIAHIGVIQVLEKNGISIERIAGTSMGSIIGGLHAAGYKPETLARIFEEIEWAEHFTNTPKRRSIYVTEKETTHWPLFNVRFHGFNPQIPSSLSSGQKIISMLSWLSLIPDYECGGNFDRLPIPFRSVATDLSTGDSVVLGRGNLARAIQASSTIPLIFTPIELDGKLLVDGGLKNNLPVSVVREMGSDFVIAVAIDESMHERKERDNALNIADQVTSILMKTSTELSRNLADFVINPDMETFSSRKFEHIPGIIEQGRVAAKEALPALLDSIEKRKSAYRKIFIRGINVFPQNEERFVSDIVLRYILTDSEHYFANIIEALEALWKTGRYFNISADIDETTGILHIELLETPDTVNLLFHHVSTNKTYNRRIDIV